VTKGVAAPARNLKLEAENSTRAGRSESHTPNFSFRPYLPWAAAVLSGLLLTACFPKLHLRGLVWVACVPLFTVLAKEKRLKRAFLMGYVCGAVFFAGTCYWFTMVMESYGHLAPALAFLVLVLFVIVDSVFFGVFGLAMGWVARGSPARVLSASPFLWVAMELGRTYLITGFPWNLLGYAVQASGLRQIASFTAVYGLSFIAVTSSALLVWVILSPKRVHAILALAVWVGFLLAAQWKLNPPPEEMGKETAFLLQPNVPLDDAALESWIPWRNPSNLEQLVQLSVATVEQVESKTPSSRGEGGAGHLPLLIWAENPAPFFFTRDPVFRGAMETMARRAHAIVITNTVVPLDAQGHTITNTAITLSPEGREISRYDKIHLVPFGEYVPWWALPGLVHKITSEVGDFVPGSNYSVADSPGGGIGVFICYEAIIPQLARKLVERGAGVLVNISNDAWYGDSAAAYQHVEMARLRAIENHRYLLRATNDGLTTVTDPYGRILEEIPRHQRRVMVAHFNFESGKSFYSTHGDVFAWFCGLVAAGVLIAGLAPRSKDPIPKTDN
jgi:apolipoprotein N-acyltransferase